MGDCPSKYMEFNDEEDSYLKQYENETTKMIRTPEGELFYTWDDKFQIKRTYGLSLGSDNRAIPDDCVEVDISHKERYESFEEFMSDWIGYEERDPKTNKYGHWANPNSKWDWNTIGGRWSGQLLLVKAGTDLYCKTGTGRFGQPEKAKPNTTDICLISELDMPRIKEETDKGASVFWNKYVYLRKHGEDEVKDVWGESRSTAMSLGLCKIIFNDPKKAKNLGGFRWGDKTNFVFGDKRAHNYDVYNLDITREEFMYNCAEHFNPIVTFAVLDESGWHEAGEMGWFGCDLSDPNDKKEFTKTFTKKFILDKDHDTTLVVVDCHI